MKFLRATSDIHLDRDIALYHGTRIVSRDELGRCTPLIRCEMDMLWFPPSMDDDFETTFIVAGDLWADSRFATRKWPDSNDTWIMRLSRRFKYVVLVLGNHDYWDRNILYEAAYIKKAIADQGITNVFLLEKDAIVLDQVKFVGGTLWTDFNRHDPQVMFMMPSLINDYRFIRHGKDYRKLRTIDQYEIHQNTKKFIFENVKRDYPEQKVVVVTHMAPSIQSISAHHLRASEMTANYYYFSDLEKRVMAEGQDIDYWFHGHTHHSVQYEIGNVKVILNAKGYWEHENPGFDPKLLVPI